MRYNASFEVIMSESDFVVKTYYSGPRQCKFETERYFVALYQTPVQVKVSGTKFHHDLFFIVLSLAHQALHRSSVGKLEANLSGGIALARYIGRPP
ncbi:unnamed protein product [Angiostrongylus costaricensis]|uniref:Transposase n=1 Tax=Angiostrongylus costaricensis TaxID=334426 RepID=A0A0R3PGZ0_ANGCS|nr:unnamed protein product [Angiostrongylus costaricensis]